MLIATYYDTNAIITIIAVINMSKSKLFSNDIDASAKKDSHIYLFDTFANPEEQDKQVTYDKVDMTGKKDASQADWLPPDLQSNEMVISLLGAVSPEHFSKINPKSRGVFTND